MFAAWQAMWALQAASALVCGRLARLHAVEEIADVERRRIAVDLGDRSPGQQFRRTQHQLAAVARFDPAGLSLEPHRARAQRNPTGLAEDQLDAVGVAGDHAAVLRRVVLDGGRCHRRRPIGTGRRSASPIPARRRPTSPPPFSKLKPSSSLALNGRQAAGPRYMSQSTTFLVRARARPAASRSSWRSCRPDGHRRS